MKRFPQIFLMTLVICFAATAAPCTLKQADLPKLRGIYLGMPIKELEPKIENSRGNQVADDDSHSLRLYLRLLGDSPDPDFEGLEQIVFVLIDDKVVSFDLTYASDATNWRDKFHDLLDKFTTSLHLPGDAWNVASYGPSADMSCSDFNLSVEASSGPELKVESSDYQRIISERKADANRKRQQIFKP